MVAVADLRLLGPAMITVHSIRRGMRAVSVEAIPVLIDGNELLRFFTLEWKGSRKEVQ